MLASDVHRINQAGKYNVTQFETDVHRINQTGKYNVTLFEITFRS
jgi:hypothetical protein